MSLRFVVVAAALSLSSLPALADPPAAAASPGKTHPADDALADYRRSIKPWVEKAHAAWPDAKRRYLTGLPRGEHLSVTALLVDKEHHFQPAFIFVDSIDKGVINGRISSEVGVVHGYRKGDRYSLAEADMVDWIISLRDGSEEGDFVGKFLDTPQ